MADSNGFTNFFGVRPGEPSYAAKVEAYVIQDSSGYAPSKLGESCAIQRLNFSEIIPARMGSPLPQATPRRPNINGPLAQTEPRTPPLGEEFSMGANDMASLKIAIARLGISLEQSVKDVERSVDIVIQKAIQDQQAFFLQLMHTPHSCNGDSANVADKPAVGNAQPVKKQQAGTVDREKLNRFSHNPFAAHVEEARHDCFDEIETTDQVTHEDGALGGGSLSSVFLGNHDLDLGKHAYNVSDYYKTEGIWQNAARHPIMENLTLFMVVMNAIYIGIEADWNTKQNLLDSDMVFIVSSYTFCVYFTAELWIRFMAFRKKRDCFRDGWFNFDLFLVFTMILDICILMPMLKSSGRKNLKIPTQPLRMLRLLKMSRMARLMKVFPELVVLIRSIAKSIRAGVSTFVVLMLFNYGWGILMHMMLKNKDQLNEALYSQSFMDFTTLPKSMWILLMDGTLLLDNSALLMSQLVFSKDYIEVLAGICYVLYLFLSSQLILQTLVAMLVDVVNSINQEQRHDMATALLKQELLQDLLEFSEDAETVSQQQLMELMSNKKSGAVLRKLRINTFLLYELQKMLFASSTRTNQPIRKILELMLVCRGGEIVTVDTMAKGFNFICQDLQQIQVMLNYLHQELGTE